MCHTEGGKLHVKMPAVISCWGEKEVKKKQKKKHLETKSIRGGETKS